MADAFRDGAHGTRRHSIDLLRREVVERNDVDDAVRQHRLQLRGAVQCVCESRQPRPRFLPEMDHENHYRCHPVARQHAVEHLLRRLQLLPLKMIVFHLTPPGIPSDGRRHEASPCHDGACAGLVLQHHQQSRRHVAVGDLQFRHNVIADFLIPSPCDGLRISLLQ